MGRKGQSSSGPGKTKTRAAKASSSALPEVYQELPADTLVSTPTLLSEDGRGVKRRRVGGRIVTYGGDLPSGHGAVPAVNMSNATTTELNHDLARVPPQVIYNDSENSSESDMDWEEVEIEDKLEAELSEDEKKELNLVLGANETVQKDAVQRRKPIGVAERSMRLEIHKMHILGLLAHVHLRNHWCNDHAAQVRRIRPSNKRLS